MNFLIFLLKAIICSAILYAYYFFFLRNKQFHQYNRYYLLLSVVLSLLLPVIKIPIFISSSQSQTLNLFTASELKNAVVIKSTGNWFNQLLNWQTFVYGSYIVVCMI